MEYIQLKKNNIFRLGIKDIDGNIKLDENGNEVYIEFDLEDIETPARYDTCVLKVKQAQNKLKSQYLIIEKKQDSKGKGSMSVNEEAKYKAMKQFYKDIEEAMDFFVGKGGTEKIFGKRRYLSMWDDFNDMIEPFLPKIKVNLDEISKKIKSKYSEKEKDVLADEDIS